MASMDDILTTAKNLVVAVNTLSTTYLQVAGQRIATGVAAGVVLQTGSGRICTVNVIVAGAAGAAYDTNAVASVAASNQLMTIPATVGPIVVNLPFITGLVVVPGAGQTVSVSYS